MTWIFTLFEHVKEQQSPQKQQ